MGHQPADCDQTGVQPGRAIDCNLDGTVDHLARRRGIASYRRTVHDPRQRTCTVSTVLLQGALVLIDPEYGRLVH